VIERQDLADEIMDWKSAGLTDIVSLLEEHEVRDCWMPTVADSSTSLRRSSMARGPEPLTRRDRRRRPNRCFRR
jgi:hypothetical protein